MTREKKLLAPKKKYHFSKMAEPHTTHAEEINDPVGAIADEDKDSQSESTEDINDDSQLPPTVRRTNRLVSIFQICLLLLLKKIYIYMISSFLKTK